MQVPQASGSLLNFSHSPFEKWGLKLPHPVMVRIKAWEERWHCTRESHSYWIHCPHYSGGSRSVVCSSQYSFSPLLTQCLPSAATGFLRRGEEPLQQNSSGAHCEECYLPPWKSPLANPDEQPENRHHSFPSVLQIIYPVPMTTECND